MRGGRSQASLPSNSLKSVKTDLKDVFTDFRTDKTNFKDFVAEKGMEAMKRPWWDAACRWACARQKVCTAQMQRGKGDVPN